MSLKMIDRFCLFFSDYVSMWEKKSIITLYLFANFDNSLDKFTGFGSK